MFLLAERSHPELEIFFVMYCEATRGVISMMMHCSYNFKCIACLVMFFSNIKSEEEQTSVARRSASAKNLNVELDVCDM